MRDDEFRRAVGDVRPLRQARRAELRAPAPSPEPRQRRRDELAALAESLAGPMSVEDALDSGEEASYLRPGLPRQALRRLRRGHWVVQAELDLHGQNRAQAAAAAAAFLGACAARGARCVRIVHGKGLGSPNREPVLKQVMTRMLARRDDVLAYCQAPAAQGGGGAMLVLLRGRR